jgi:hypothetical protein
MMLLGPTAELVVVAEDSSMTLRHIITFSWGVNTRKGRNTR